MLETDPDTVLPMLTVNAEPLLAYGNAFITDELKRSLEAGYRLSASPEVCAELLTRLSHSFLLTPASVVPLDDPEALRSMFRSTLVRMIQTE